MPSFLDPVALVATELVTNAFRHGRPPIWMRLHRNSELLKLEVGDAKPKNDSPGLPGPSLTAESGRGLMLVRALSEDFGIDPVPGDGKIARATWWAPKP